MARTKCVLSRRTALAVFGGAAATVAMGCNANVPSARGEGDAIRYQYGEEPSQFAEISVPSGSAPAPVVVIVHGGYWQAGYGLELGRPLAADLVGRGFAAVNVEYRRMGDGGGWPQTGEDVAAAVAALTSQAHGRLDLNRIVGLGHSVGGQLAGWLASKRDSAVPLTGVVLQAGVLDLVRGADEGLGGGAIVDYLGGTPTERPDAYAQASPIALVPLGVPSICVHGTGDGLVPIEQSERFVAAAQRAGDRSELRIFDGDHFQPINVGTPAWDLCVQGVRQMAGAD